MGRYESRIEDPDCGVLTCQQSKLVWVSEAQLTFVVGADQLLEARILGEDTLVSLELEVTILDRNIREEAGLIQPTSY
jgi:hypothetical protein